MNLQKVCSALCSATRIEILKILACKPMSMKEVMDRASVYRALEKLASAGLVQKYYDSERKGIHYRVLKARLNIDLISGTVE